MKDIDRVVRHLQEKHGTGTQRDDSIFERGMMANSLAKPRAEYPLIATPPRQLKIEMTNICNQRCVYCPNRDMRRAKGFIDAELVRSVVREAKELAINEIGFYTTGESLLHPQLPELIRYAKEQGIPYTFLDTNGALLTPDRAAALMDAGLDSLKYSCSAGTRETYRAIHGCDDFDRVLEHMRATHALRAARGGRKPHLAISYIVSRDNEAEIPRLRESAKPYIDEMPF
ncbi:MAG TPA: radical SAM protein, partial [bacterium]|nr:radical SAM protein [bacterium]